MRSAILLLLFTSAVRCATPFVDAASLITMASLRTGGNMADSLQGAKNPERNQ